jgi:phosphotransferase system enzyme I (PtsP)
MAGIRGDKLLGLTVPMAASRTHQEMLLPVVHAGRHGPQVERIFDLVRAATNPKPLTECIDSLTQQVATILAADVCSVYLREGDDLVMRANVGFPASALTDVRLTIGEGITGMAVECMRPISLSVARSHANYRHFPELGEERFPIFVAVPLPGSHGPLGALVLQRRAPPAFSAESIDLAVALTAPICATVEDSHLVGEPGTQKAAGGRTRRVTLTGRSVVRGRTFGRCMAVERTRPETRASAETPAPRSIEASLTRAVASARRLVSKRQQSSADRHVDLPLLATYISILDDARLRGRILELANDGMSLMRALATVSAEAARAATRSGDPFRLARAQAIADISEVLSYLLIERSRVTSRGMVLLADRLGGFELLLAQPAGIILTGRQIDENSRQIAHALGAPTVEDVPAIYRWIHEGDTLVVDANHGFVRVNPGRAEIARIREERRRQTSESDDLRTGA